MTSATTIPDRWVRTCFRYAVDAVVLAVIATVAGTFLFAPHRAAATPNECGPWYTDQDIADTTGGGCRATFLVDPGVGNLINREQLLAATGFYHEQGFDQQWLWYAPMTTVFIPDTSAQQWTSCPSSAPPLV